MGRRNKVHNNPLGNFLLDARHKQGTKATDVAKDLGVSDTMVFQVEKGKPIPWDRLEAFALVYHVELTDLALLNLKETASYKYYRKVLDQVAGFSVKVEGVS